MCDSPGLPFPTTTPQAAGRPGPAVAPHQGLPFYPPWDCATPLKTIPSFSSSSITTTSSASAVVAAATYSPTGVKLTEAMTTTTPVIPAPFADTTDCGTINKDFYADNSFLFQRSEVDGGSGSNESSFDSIFNCTDSASAAMRPSLLPVTPLTPSYSSHDPFSEKESAGNNNNINSNVRPVPPHPFPLFSSEDSFQGIGDFDETDSIDQKLASLNINGKFIYFFNFCCFVTSFKENGKGCSHFFNILLFFLNELLHVHTHDWWVKRRRRRSHFTVDFFSIIFSLSICIFFFLSVHVRFSFAIFFIVSAHTQKSYLS